MSLFFETPRAPDTLASLGMTGGCELPLVEPCKDLDGACGSIIFVEKSEPMEERNDIVIYRSEDGLVKMEALVDPSGETIWASQKAIAALFGKDVSDISRHIRNVYATGELAVESTLQKMQIPFSDRPVQYYNLDIIISVGYRVNSKRATNFRIWATRILRQYMLQGFR